MPIVVLSARGAEGDKVRALDVGADDYVTKPFGAEELLARIRAALRRSDAPSPPSEPIVRGGLTIDRERFRVLRDGEEVRLTPKEFELLTYLAQHPGRVLTHRTILKAIWGPNAVDQPEHLRVLVGALRKKIEANPSSPKYILTEPWVGYRFSRRMTNRKVPEDQGFHSFQGIVLGAFQGSGFVAELRPRSFPIRSSSAARTSPVLRPAQVRWPARHQGFPARGSSGRRHAAATRKYGTLADGKVYPRGRSQTRWASHRTSPERPTP